MNNENINQTNINQPTIEQPNINQTNTIQEQPVLPTNIVQPPVVEPSKKKKNPIGIIIIIFILIALIVGGIIFFINNKDKDSSNKDKTTEKIEIVEEGSTYEKLNRDYKDKKIDVNKYFTELVYYEYNNSKLDKKYQSDENDYTNENINELIGLLKDHQEEIDKDITKEFLKYVTLENVKLKNKTPENQSNRNNKPTVKMLASEDASDHTLNKVKLSNNGKFLIWYTNDGEDGITNEQATNIIDTLENTVKKYEELFNIEYSYKPIKDRDLTYDDTLAKLVLKENNIDESVLDTAMSIYVYETGSLGTLAYYSSYENYTIIQELLVKMGIGGSDGIISTPYIVMNKTGLSSFDNAIEVTNHELFHHFQALYCNSLENNQCPGYTYFTEGMANLASAKVSNVTIKNGFLNKWAGFYKENTEKNLKRIAYGDIDGYPTFPYLYAYSEVVSNWSSILMQAHKEFDPYYYIYKNTPKDQLVKASERLARGCLANDFNNNTLFSTKEIKIKETLKKQEKISEDIYPGAIIYYKVSGNNNITLTSGNNETVGLVLYGFKDGNYTELEKTMTEKKIDLSAYSDYKNLYVVVFNANIHEGSTYNIEINQNESEPEPEKPTPEEENKTGLKNYNIDMKMEIEVSGVSTTSISKGVIDEVHQKEYLETEMTAMGAVKITNKTYHDFNTGYTYMTQPMDPDTWIKEKSNSQVIDLKKIQERLKSMKDVTKISDNHYKIKMNKDEISGVLSSGKASSSLISGNIYIEAYIENGYVSRVEFDFSDLIKGFDKFTVNIRYYNYNQAGDVEIPQSVITSAN